MGVLIVYFAASYFLGHSTLGATAWTDTKLRATIYNLIDSIENGRNSSFDNTVRLDLRVLYYLVGARKMPCDAFISYSRSADSQLALTLQSGLHRFAKPLFKMRALHAHLRLVRGPGRFGSICGALSPHRSRNDKTPTEFVTEHQQAEFF